MAVGLPGEPGGEPVARHGLARVDVAEDALLGIVPPAVPEVDEHHAANANVVVCFVFFEKRKYSNASSQITEFFPLSE